MKDMPHRRLSCATRRLLVLSMVAAGTLACHAESLEVDSGTLFALNSRCARPFGDNAVLQQKIQLPVWGTSLPGAKVIVAFDGQVKKTVTDKDGNWRLELDPLDAVKLKSVNDAPAGKTMTITFEGQGVTIVKEIKDLLVGDVWVSSGQSNMAGCLRTIIVKEDGRMNPDGKVKELKLPFYAADTITSANFPALRQLGSEDDESWTVCSPETAWQFRKVAFFFARRLQREVLVPIGILPAAKGGSKIETWLNQKPYETGTNYVKYLEQLVGYGIKGALWYQGESNEDDRRAYQPKLESLITGWRKVWQQADFPFYYVQLPGIGASPSNSPAMGDGRAEIRQACVEALKLKNTGMAVTIDIGDTREHPPNKVDTGIRLAHAALRMTYGFKDIPVCPLYKSHKIEGSAVRIFFHDAEDGLMIALKEDARSPKPMPGAKIGWLSIQAKDGKWHWAEGKIDGSDLLVSCKDVKNPIAVRYAYTRRPLGPLLYNKEGMPVGPFSTIGYGPEQPVEGKSKKGEK